MSTSKRNPNRPLRFEQLEDRRVLSGIIIKLYRSELRILGTPDNDKVTVSEQAGALTVEYQTGNGPLESVTFGPEQIEHLQKVVFFGKEGNDTFDGSKAAHKLVLDGGAGNDILHGGPANDTLRGGPDFDRLYGRGGDQDFLDGGRDWFADFLDAGSGKSTETVETADGEDFNAYKPVLGPDGGINIGDVNQQGGPCGFAAALAAVAGDSSKARQDLATRIRYAGARKYVVTLYTAPGVARDVEVRFDGSVTPTDLSARSPSLDEWREARNKFGHDVLPKRGYSGEFWPLLYQRAYLQIAGQISEAPGAIDRPLLALTGRLPQRIAANQDRLLPDSARDKMIAALSQGKPVAAGTYKSSSLLTTNLLVADHSYTVSQLWKDSSGQWMVRARNPWGHDHRYQILADGTVKKDAHTGNFWDGVVEVSWNHFRQSFSNVYIGG